MPHSNTGSQGGIGDKFLNNVRMSGPSTQPRDDKPLLNKVAQLEEQLKNDAEKAKKDSQFYEEALEKRFEQMEKYQEKSDEFESKCVKLEAELRKAELDRDKALAEEKKDKERLRKLELDLTEKSKEQTE